MTVFDQERPCPKCGCRLVLTRYRENYGKGELWRKCERCGYAWSETPLDGAAQPEKEKR